MDFKAGDIVLHYRSGYKVVTVGANYYMLENEDGKYSVSKKRGNENFKLKEKRKKFYLDI